MACETCGDNAKSVVIHRSTKKLVCWPCWDRLNGEARKFGQAPSVIPDEIPGGVEIKHLYSEPTKFYSKSAIRQAAFDKGVVWGTDTPKINQRLIDEEGSKR